MILRLSSIGLCCFTVLFLSFFERSLSAQGSRSVSSNVSTDSAPSVFLGIDVLEERGFDLLRARRVGLLTHPAGVNRRGESTVDVLRRASAVNLAALYGPEHGIYGDEQASVPIDDRIDERTGLPVYSLYGQYRKPTPEMLSGIDVLVIDLQDIGVRSYTFVSCMRLAIEACFENGVEVVVLDRPNPLGGMLVDGPPLDREWLSYVGAYPVPYVHGLTIGEIARIAASTPGWLHISEEDRKRGKISVVPMRGWKRSMLWPATRLNWIPTSPYVPTPAAALGYAMTGLGAQLGGFQHGIGSPHPFRLLSFRNQDLDKVERELTRANIRGIRFQRLTYTNNAGRRVPGLYVEVTDWSRFRPTELSFHMMRIAAQFNGSNPFSAATANQEDLFNKHVGSTAWWDALTTHGANISVAPFVDRWERQSRAFQNASRPFWFYQ